MAEERELRHLHYFIALVEEGSPTGYNRANVPAADRIWGRPVVSHCTLNALKLTVRP